MRIIHLFESLPFRILIGLSYMIVIHTRFTRTLNLIYNSHIVMLLVCIYRHTTIWCRLGCHDPKKVQARAHQAAPLLWLQASCQLSGKPSTVWTYCIRATISGPIIQTCPMPVSIILDRHRRPFCLKIFCRHVLDWTPDWFIMGCKLTLRAFQTSTKMCHNSKILWTFLYKEIYLFLVGTNFFSYQNANQCILLFCC